MAATNYTPIQLYYSTTASAAPTAGNLVNGELAINITDGKLYYKDNGGNVQVIATKGAGTIGGSNTQIQFNDGGALAGNAAMVFNKATNVTTLTTLNLTNALGATYGGTAQSAYAQGDLLYASAVNTLSKLSIGTVNYILTSTGSVPQWVAPTSVTVQTANNLAGGAAGSVPYQSAADTTTFLSIGAANRVMTSTGSAPQWVTSLTGLTGVSSSSMTNTSLTSGRVVYSGASGVQTDSANLTFNGTTLSAGGFSTTGNSTLVKLVTVGDSGFTTGAVLAAATPAKLYIGTGAVTDGSSAGGATNTLGTITAFGQTQVIATNANVTYTNLATLYVAGAPTAGTNVTITNPYAFYVAGGASYFGGAVDFAVTPSYSGGTANGVMYLNASKQITTGSALTFDGTTLSVANGVTGGTSISLTGTYAGSGTVAFMNFQRVGGAVAGTLGYDDANNAIRFGTTTNHSTIFLQNNTDTMYLTSTGFGVGVSPANKFDVYQGTAGIGAGRIRHVNGNAINIQPSYNYYDAYNHIFRSLSATTEYARFLDNGYFGIGTNAPVALLNVASGTNTTLSVPSGVVAQFKGSVVINSLSTASSGTVDSLYFQKSHTSGINISNYDLGIIKSFTGNGYTGGFDFYTGKSTGGGSYAATFAMRIDELQNVGVQVVPATWASDWSMVQVGSLAGFGQYSGTASTMVTYNYYNSGTGGSGPKYLANGYASVYQQATGYHYWYSAPNNSSGAGAAVTDLTQVLSVRRNESLALQGGNNYSGTGITFPSSQYASSDANTLDDYEEGDWTPTLATNGFSGGATLSSASGRYTKIGRLVSATAQLTMSGFCYPSGYVLIGSLPFTVGYGSVGSYTGSHPGSGNMGGACAAFSTNIDASASASATTSNVWTYTVTFIV